jgi:hypothetical protein
VGIGAVAGVEGFAVRADIGGAYKDYTHGFRSGWGLEIGEGEAGIKALAHPLGDFPIGFEFGV